MPETREQLLHPAAKRFLKKVRNVFLTEGNSNKECFLNGKLSTGQYSSRNFSFLNDESVIPNNNSESTKFVEQLTKEPLANWRNIRKETCKKIYDWLFDEKIGQLSNFIQELKKRGWKHEERILWKYDIYKAVFNQYMQELIKKADPKNSGQGPKISAYFDNDGPIFFEFVDKNLARLDELFPFFKVEAGCKFAPDELKKLILIKQDVNKNKEFVIQHMNPYLALIEQKLSKDVGNLLSNIGEMKGPEKAMLQTKLYVLYRNLIDLISFEGVSIEKKSSKWNELEKKISAVSDESNDILTVENKNALCGAITQKLLSLNVESNLIKITSSNQSITKKLRLLNAIKAQTEDEAIKKLVDKYTKQCQESQKKKGVGYFFSQLLESFENYFYSKKFNKAKKTKKNLLKKKKCEENNFIKNKKFSSSAINGIPEVNTFIETLGNTLDIQNLKTFSIFVENYFDPVEQEQKKPLESPENIIFENAN